MLARTTTKSEPSKHVCAGDATAVSTCACDLGLKPAPAASLCSSPCTNSPSPRPRPLPSAAPQSTRPAPAPVPCATSPSTAGALCAARSAPAAPCSSSLQRTCQISDEIRAQQARIRWRCNSSVYMCMQPGAQACARRVLVLFRPAAGMPNQRKKNSRKNVTSNANPA